MGIKAYDEEDVELDAAALRSLVVAICVADGVTDSQSVVSGEVCDGWVFVATPPPRPVSPGMALPG